MFNRVHDVVSTHVRLAQHPRNVLFINAPDSFHLIVICQKCVDAVLSPPGLDWVMWVGELHADRRELCGYCREEV